MRRYSIHHNIKSETPPPNPIVVEAEAMIHDGENVRLVNYCPEMIDYITVAQVPQISVTALYSENID